MRGCLSVNIFTQNYLLRAWKARYLGQVLHNPLNGQELELNHLCQRVARFKAYSYSSKVDMNLAEVRKVVVEESCNLVLDLRDNPYLKTLVVKDNFRGKINLSRSSIRKIKIGANCHCELIVHNSRACFSLCSGEAWSGKLEVKNSCFHWLSLGKNCSTLLILQENRGRKNIMLGDGFRGSVEARGLAVPKFETGNDCEGKIELRDGSADNGVRKLLAGDDFVGTIEASMYPYLEWAEFGCRAAGKINFQACPSLKVLKFERGFKGNVDLSGSGIEYVRALEEAVGNLVVVRCENLLQMKLPADRKAVITSDRYPIRVKSGGVHLYYLFSNKSTPWRYHTPFYAVWWKAMRRYLRKQFNV